MIFKMYHGDDFVILKADTIQELQIQAEIEIAKRGWKQEDCWSEEIGRAKCDGYLRWKNRRV